MRITWLGHACFLLEQSGYRVVIDPYEDMEGYPPLCVEAHGVFCSHSHFDHSGVSRVKRLPERACPFAVREVACFHDDQGGALRGNNLIRVFTAGGVSVAHLGDLGHLLTSEQAEQVGAVNGVLVPVGGGYTLDAAGARAVCEALSPEWVVPMHYRHDPYGLADVAPIDDFVGLWPPKAVRRLGTDHFTPDERTRGVLVLSFK